MTLLNWESWVGVAAIATDQENFLIVKKLLGRERGLPGLASLLKTKQGVFFFQSQSWSCNLITDTNLNMLNILMYSESDYITYGDKLSRLRETK